MSTSRIDCYALPATEAVIHDRPILAIAADLAKGMNYGFGGLTLPEMADKLAELHWFDDDQHKADCSPGTLWWTVVHILSPGGVDLLHLQAEPFSHGVVVFEPRIVEDVLQGGPA